MTSGALIVGSIAAPLAAALLPAARGAAVRTASIAAGVIVLILAAGVMLTAVLGDRGLSVRAELAAWKTLPDEDALSLSLTIPRRLAAAPGVIAAVALVVLASTSAERFRFVHLQLAAAQGALSAASPELSLLFVSLGTGAAAIHLTSGDETSSRHGLSVGFRWALADLVLWGRTLGYLGGDVSGDVLALVACAVRCSVFPFQGSLTRTYRINQESALLLTPVPALIWGSRFLSNEATAWPLFPIFACVAVLAPPVLAILDRRVDQALCAVAVVAWPAAWNGDTASSVAVIGLGAALLLLKPSSIWARFTAVAMAAIPAILLVRTHSADRIPLAVLAGWAAVSLSAALIGGIKDDVAAERPPLRVIGEASLVLFVLAAVPNAFLRLGETQR